MEQSNSTSLINLKIPSISIESVIDLKTKGFACVKLPSEVVDKIRSFFGLLGDYFTDVRNTTTTVEYRRGYKNIPQVKEFTMVCDNVHTLWLILILSKLHLKDGKEIDPPISSTNSSLTVEIFNIFFDISKQFIISLCNYLQIEPQKLLTFVTGNQGKNLKKFKLSTNSL